MVTGPGEMQPRMLVIVVTMSLRAQLAASWHRQGGHDGISMRRSLRPSTDISPPRWSDISTHVQSLVTTFKEVSQGVAKEVNNAPIHVASRASLAVAKPTIDAPRLQDLALELRELSRTFKTALGDGSRLAFPKLSLLDQAPMWVKDACQELDYMKVPVAPGIQADPQGPNLTALLPDDTSMIPGDEASNFSVSLVNDSAAEESDWAHSVSNQSSANLTSSDPVSLTQTGSDTYPPLQDTATWERDYVTRDGVSGMGDTSNLYSTGYAVDASSVTMKAELLKEKLYNQSDVVVLALDMVDLARRRVSASMATIESLKMALNMSNSTLSAHRASLASTSQTAELVREMRGTALSAATATAESLGFLNSNLIKLDAQVEVGFNRTEHFRRDVEHNTQERERFRTEYFTTEALYNMSSRSITGKRDELQQAIALLDVMSENLTALDEKMNAEYSEQQALLTEADGDAEALNKTLQTKLRDLVDQHNTLTMKIHDQSLLVSTLSDEVGSMQETELSSNANMSALTAQYENVSLAAEAAVQAYREHEKAMIVLINQRRATANETATAAQLLQNQKVELTNITVRLETLQNRSVLLEVAAKNTTEELKATSRDLACAEQLLRIAELELDNRTRTYDVEAEKLRMLSDELAELQRAAESAESAAYRQEYEYHEAPAPTPAPTSAKTPSSSESRRRSSATLGGVTNSDAQPEDEKGSTETPPWMIVTLSLLGACVLLLILSLG